MLILAVCDGGFNGFGGHREKLLVVAISRESLMLQGQLYAT